jgi:hypothetical protein
VILPAGAHTVFDFPVIESGLAHGVALCWTALMAKPTESRPDPILMSTQPDSPSQQREHWQQWCIAFSHPVLVPLASCDESVGLFVCSRVCVCVCVRSLLPLASVFGYGVHTMMILFGSNQRSLLPPKRPLVIQPRP